MNFNITIETEEFEDMLVHITTGMQKSQYLMDQYGPSIAQAAEQAILAEISSLGRFGVFMADRTKITPTYMSGAVVLSITGMSEGEAGFPERSGGPTTAQMNLWMKHEYGSFTSDSESEQTYMKNRGAGVIAIRKSRSASVGSPYRGLMGETISAMTVQLDLALNAIAGMSAYSIAGGIVESATKGKVKIGRGVRSLMKGAGVTMADLQAANIVSIGIKGGGQVYAVAKDGAGHTWKSPSSLGLPTTIRT